MLALSFSGFDPERTSGATYSVRHRRTLGSPRNSTVVVPAIEPTADPATPNQVALISWPIPLPAGEQKGPVITSGLDERIMFQCSFSFMKSSLALSRSICASIASARFGPA
jgi:hypothetical protein